jgi:biopolymer transport protein ExbD
MKRFEKISEKQVAELDLKPFINFLVIMIPVLMLSAEFSKVAIIDLTAPDRPVGVDPNRRDTVRPPAGPSAELGLTLLVSDSTIILGSRQGLLPTMYYKEYHTYVSKHNRNATVTVAYDAHNPKSRAVNPATGRLFGLDERQSIDLYVEDEGREIVRCLYGKEGELVTDREGNPLSKVKTGDQVFLLGSERKVTQVADPSAFTLRPLSAYDALRNRLALVRQRYASAPDRTHLCIAAEHSVIYDKIVQLMDVARAADFPDISIGRL